MSPVASRRKGPVMQNCDFLFDVGKDKLLNKQSIVVGDLRRYNSYDVTVIM